MVQLVTLASLIFLGSVGSIIAHRASLDIDADEDVSIVAKAQGLLATHMKRVNVSGDEVATALRGDPALHEEVNKHVDGEELSSALLERARSAMGGHVGLDAAVRRKETPCHCVIEKVKDVDMDRDLKMSLLGTHVDLELDDFPVTADHGPANIKFTDFDSEGKFGSGGKCQQWCMSKCKNKGKYGLDKREMRLLGVENVQNEMVAAQCDGKKCKCLDMDRTKKYIKALRTVQDKGRMDIASYAMKTFPSEGDCLGGCKGMCEHVEKKVDHVSGVEIDWEGVCFDERWGE